MDMSDFWVPEPSPLSLVYLIIQRTLATFISFLAYKISLPFFSLFQSPVEFIVRTDWSGFHELSKTNRVKIA